MCFQFTHSPCNDWENTYTLSYYHHQIGSMNYYPLFRVRSWNNGVRCMSFYILTLSIIDLNFLYQFNLRLHHFWFVFLFCFFNVKNLFFKRMQVCDKLAKWLIMLGFMDLRWPRVARRSNAALVLFYLGRKMFTQCSKMFSFQVKSNIQNNILTLHMHAWWKGWSLNDDR